MALVGPLSLIECYDDMKLGDISLADLVQRCLESGREQDWAELVQHLQPVLAREVYRVVIVWGSANAPEIDDIVQEIFLKLGRRGGEMLRSLPLDNEQSTLAFFKVMAANSARDYLKSKYADKRGVDRTVSVEPNLTELISITESQTQVETQILIGQVDAVLNADVRERTIFWLYYRQGFTAKEIAAIPGIGLTAKGVESLIYRLAMAARKCLRPSEEDAAGSARKGQSPLESS